jgi:hypothetical protein
MGKYDALARHLRRRRQDSLDMTFDEIERVLGAMLPKRAARVQWWTDPANPVAAQQEAWRAAGYEAALAPGGGAVRFTSLL